MKKSTPQELFLQANDAYAHNAYEKALGLYEQIPHKGAAVWYNMGNCAYKTGDNIKALLYWKRSSLRGDRILCAQSNNNCALIEQKLSLAPQPILPPSILMWQILFFCAFGVFLVSGRYLIRSKKYLILGAASIIIAAIGCGTFSAYRYSRTTYALVIPSHAVIYAGPDIQYHELAKISAGGQVLVLDRKNSWAKVTWENKNGWIAQLDIEII